MCTAVHIESFSTSVFKVLAPEPWERSGWRGQRIREVTDIEARLKARDSVPHPPTHPRLFPN